MSLRRTRLMELVEAGHKRARAVLALREEPEDFLATVQVGITVVSATAAAFGGAALAARLEPVLAQVAPLADYAGELSLAVVIATVSFLSIVLGELVPKSLALRAAERYALLVAAPLRGLSYLARPLVWLLTVSSNVVLRPFGDRTTFTETRHSSEELQQLVEEATRAGSVHPDAGQIASRALELPDLVLTDVMIPRQRVVMLPRGAPPEELRQILREHTHSRMPVYEGTVDHVVGYVSVKDLLSVAWEHKLVVLEDVIRPAFFVPEAKRAVDLLQDMRRKRVPFAVVVDEQGGMSGIVTMEDLIEELVGEIFSEHDLQAPEQIRMESAHVFLVDGAAPLREVNRALRLEIPEEGDWTTIAGYFLGQTGRIPAVGDKLAVDGGVLLEIAEASARRIRRVRVHLPPPRPEPDDTSAPR